MKEILELLGPESKAALRQLAGEVSSDQMREKHGEAAIEIGHDDLMGLRETDGSWYIVGESIKEIEPFLFSEEEVEKFEEEEAVVEEGINHEDSIDAQKVKELLPDSLGTSFHVVLAESVCPEDVPATKGEVFTCDETTESGEHYQAEIEVVDGSGDVVVLRQKPSAEY